jgi:hypothetical protein
MKTSSSQSHTNVQLLLVPQSHHRSVVVVRGKEGMTSETVVLPKVVWHEWWSCDLTENGRRRTRFSNTHFLKTEDEGSTRLPYTGWLGELEHLKIKTRLTLDGNPGNRATGHPNPVPCSQGIFFYFFSIFFNFFGGKSFLFWKKKVSLSVSFSLVVHVLSVFCGLMYSTTVRW